MKRRNTKGYITVWLLAAALIAPALGLAQGKASESWTKKDLMQAIASAKTADDHNRIAQYYRHDADRLDGEAKEHAAIAEEYRTSPIYQTEIPLGGHSVDHCKWMANRSTEMAKKARELAKVHEDMAKAVKQ